MWDNENIHQIYGDSWACDGNLVVNLPIVRIDPNSRRQPHQPIVTRGAIQALAIAIYLALVVVEREIHEYTTKRNVDNLFLCWRFTTFDSINFHTHGNGSLLGDSTEKRARSLSTQWKPSCTSWTLFLSYRFLLRHQQLLSFETF